MTTAQNQKELQGDQPAYLMLQPQREQTATQLVPGSSPLVTGELLKARELVSYEQKSNGAQRKSDFPV